MCGGVGRAFIISATVSLAFRSSPTPRVQAEIDSSPDVRSKNRGANSATATDAIVFKSS